MGTPTSDERRKVLQPSLLPVPGHIVPDPPVTSTISVHSATSDHYGVSNGVTDGAGLTVTVINNVTNIIITSLHLTLTLCHV